MALYNLYPTPVRVHLGSASHGSCFGDALKLQPSTSLRTTELGLLRGTLAEPTAP